MNFSYTVTYKEIPAKLMNKIYTVTKIFNQRLLGCTNRQNSLWALNSGNGDS